MEDDDGIGGGYFFDESQSQTQNLQCVICGGTNFYSEIGLYFCSECNTQSQQTQQIVDEDLTLRAGNLRQVLRTGSTPGGGTGTQKFTEHRTKFGRIPIRKVLSTYEICNLVIKAMTEQLIQMGFPELLRDKVFQLWTAYLVRRDVLCKKADEPEESKPNAEIPAINPIENKMNYVALYEQPIPYHKRRYKKDKSDDLEVSPQELGLAMSKRLKTIERKKAFEEQYHSQTQSQDADGGLIGLGTMEEDMKDIKIQKKKPEYAGPIKPRFTHATKIVRKIYNRTRTCKEPFNFKTMMKRRPHYVNPPPGFRAVKRVLDPETFSILNVFVLLFVSLRQINCKVLFSDILRLINDGTLWIQSIRLVVDEEEFKELDQGSISRFFFAMTAQRHPLRYIEPIETFLEYVGIKQFNTPTYEEFLPKFIEEFVLPKEFECFLLEMNKMYSVKQDLEDMPKTKPNLVIIMEFLIVCRIVTILKMLFGMDDVTERYQSKFAQTVNKVIDDILESNPEAEGNKQFDDWNKLFVLEDWFSYLRYRRTIVKAELYNSKMYTPNRPPNIRRVNDVVSRYGELKYSHGRVYPTVEARTELKEFCSSMVEQVYGEVDEVPNYVSIQTPTESIFQQYKESLPTNVSYPEFANEKLLNMKFDKTRIDWIWNPDKYIPILKNAGYKVVIIPGTAINAISNKKPEEFVNNSNNDDKVIYVFQPYKYFDDYLTEKMHSQTMSFLVELCKTAIGDNYYAEKDECGKLMWYYIRELGNLYCKRADNNFIPLYNFNGKQYSYSSNRDR